MKKRSQYDKRYRRTPNGRYAELRRAAKDTGIPLGISLTEYKYLISENECFYCKKPLPPAGHGLDKVNPKDGYTVHNVVACCWECNSIKGATLTFDEMCVVANALKLFRQKTNNGQD